MNTGDHQPPEPPCVTVRCSQDPSLTVHLTGRQFVDAYETSFTIEAQADGLLARVPDAIVSVWDRDGDIPGFLQALVDDFRGWTGERTWHTNQLTLTAAFHSGGHIALTWTLRPQGLTLPEWEASVTTWIEAGQHLTSLAADLRAFFTRP
ncbi:DUF6228 family protein [Nonomuraea sp. NPDC049725]|uniref:DUF6228 family protein n=1 Tax=Nonomuraea sp. NPDC049725 TaxID=3154508 RepID=UPI00341D0D16